MRSEATSFYSTSRCANPTEIESEAYRKQAKQAEVSRPGPVVWSRDGWVLLFMVVASASASQSHQNSEDAEKEHEKDSLRDLPGAFSPFLYTDQGGPQIPRRSSAPNRHAVCSAAAVMKI